MQNVELKVADQVELISGSPTMTVEAVTQMTDGSHLVNVVWFEGKQAHRDAFDKRILTKV